MLDGDHHRLAKGPNVPSTDRRASRHRDAIESAVSRRLRLALLLCFPVLGCLAFGGVISANDKPGKVRDMSGFQVVINGANPVTELAAGDIDKMFLKKVKRWENRKLVVPVDLGQTHEIRELFTRAIHGKSVTAIESYWQRIIFSGRGERPAQKQTEEEVLAFVRELPGAIGYVSDSMTLGDGVKELKITQ